VSSGGRNRSSSDICASHPGGVRQVHSPATDGKGSTNPQTCTTAGGPGRRCGLPTTGGGVPSTSLPTASRIPATASRLPATASRLPATAGRLPTPARRVPAIVLPVTPGLPATGRVPTTGATVPAIRPTTSTAPKSLQTEISEQTRKTRG